MSKVTVRKDGPGSDDWAVYIGNQVVEELQGLSWKDARFYQIRILRRRAEKAQQGLINHAHR